MIRRVLYEVLLFLLPFALYGVYLRISKRGEDAPARAHPWSVLFVSGLVLVAASFVIWGVTEGSGQQGVYVPPHVEDGRVVPGHVESGAPK
jgi:phosphoglycerol transferase MdoB-like AlkP superfamily enzyme